MKISIFGTGYVGLVTGTCLADVGHEVMCMDVDADKIARLERGEIPIYEPGLDAMVRQNVSEGRLRFTTDAATAAERAAGDAVLGPDDRVVVFETERFADGFRRAVVGVTGTLECTTRVIGYLFVLVLRRH